ncbi:hypothetical protein GCM10020295_38730 [Streptomyces cinereospinus]
MTRLGTQVIPTCLLSSGYSVGFRAVLMTHAAESTWAQSVRDQVDGVFPELPEGISDRPADVWEPLLAIADAAGGT